MRCQGRLGGICRNFCGAICVESDVGRLCDLIGDVGLMRNQSERRRNVSAAGVKRKVLLRSPGVVLRSPEILPMSL